MSGDSRVPEGKSYCLQSWGTYYFLAVAGVFCPLIEVFFSRPRCALRKASREALESDFPPMLAAQSDFPSGPLAGFHKIFDQRIWRWPKNWHTECLSAEAPDFLLFSLLAPKKIHGDEFFSWQEGKERVTLNEILRKRRRNGQAPNV